MQHTIIALPVSLKPTPSTELYTAVRAALVAKGTSLAAWCRANGVTRQTMEQALKGQREGRRSRQLVDQLLSEISTKGKVA
jgi:gp16 family phage-associated protein